MFAHALFVRTPNRYGGVTRHRFHCDVDQGLAQMPGCRWVTGEDRRAGDDPVLVAEDTGHDALRTGTVTRLHLGHWYPRPCAAGEGQGTLLERTPQDSLIVVRPPSGRRPPGDALRIEP